MAARSYSCSEVRRRQKDRSHLPSKTSRDFCPISLRVRTDHDRGPPACRAEHPRYRIGTRAQSVHREQRDSPDIHEPSGNYRPRTAQRSAERRRSRQRPGKIAANPELQEFVREHLKQRWSPRQISNRLRANFPGQPEMHVVPETVYQALYGRGSLDLAVDPAVSLRSGRTGRRPRRRKEHRTRRFPDMVMIRDRPAEVLGRLVPGIGRAI
ncbi:IS30 family transposase [Arthrobacter oryzae]|nr:IS30 family transposase [Arthrobacter oryzae]